MIDIEKTELPGVVIIKPKRFKDERGFFAETYHQTKYQEWGINCRFVQDNLSSSVCGVLRGMHYQITRPQAKLVQCLQGRVFDVAVDLRSSSPTFGQWVGVEISSDNGYQLFIPEGFAHGFYTLSETALFSYKCSDFYKPDDEGGLHYADPAIGIKWPGQEFKVSPKDAQYPSLKQIAKDRLPK